jgi:hypothetical protein
MDTQIIVCTLFLLAAKSKTLPQNIIAHQSLPTQVSPGFGA